MYSKDEKVRNYFVENYSLDGDLDMNKTVFVTGSNRGIGKEIVRLFACNKYNIIAHSRKENNELTEYLKEIEKKYNIVAKNIVFDLTDSSKMKDELRKIYREKVNIDILVNNAGVAHGALFQMTPICDIKRVFECNLFSQMELTQMVLKIMIRNNSGCIINMASIAGLDLEQGNSAYGVSKAAVIAWTKTLAMEVANKGIRVNAIAPGLTDSDMANMMESCARIKMINNSAMERLANKSEIAEVALFLASDKASFVNGQVIRVDGGMI